LGLRVLPLVAASSYLGPEQSLRATSVVQALTVETRIAFQGGPMSQTWRSTTPGKLFTSTQPWSLTLDQDRFRLVVAGKSMAGAVLQLEDMQVEPGAFWASVRIAGCWRRLNIDPLTRIVPTEI